MKITSADSTDVMTLKLEGRLAGPWVPELEKIWRTLAPSLNSKRLRLDFRELLFVDSDGRRLLREICQEHSPEIIAETPLTRYFAEQAMQPAAVANGKH